MKMLTTAIAAAVTALGAAGPAAAYSFPPTGTQFHITGPVTLTAPQGSVRCMAEGGGHNSKRAHTQIHFQFTQPCTSAPYGIVPIGFPWPVRARSATAARIANFAFSGQGFGPCGPGHVHVNVGADGAWHINGPNLPGGCAIKGDLQTNPAMTIAP
ncbi:MAG: hypothetical protein ACR2FH_11670 [Caulobacteraceae bacterium]